MKTSRTLVVASAIAVTAVLIGVAALFPMDARYAATPTDATASVETATLEPVIVVATR